MFSGIEESLLEDLGAGEDLNVAGVDFVDFVARSVDQVLQGVDSHRVQADALQVVLECLLLPVVVLGNEVLLHLLFIARWSHPVVGASRV